MVAVVTLDAVWSKWFWLVRIGEQVPLGMSFIVSTFVVVDSVWNKDILADTTYVRWQVTYTILIAYVIKLGSIGFLGLLPTQKAETQELKRSGGSSFYMGVVTVAYCVFALVWFIMTNLFAIFESTKCLKITGGRKD